MSLSRPRRDREEEEKEGGRAGGEDSRGSTPAKRPRRCSCCPETKDFYEGQIEILKREMQCMSKGFIEERKTLQREMQEFYQNSQLQLNEQISEQQRRMEQCYHNSQLICEQFNTLISEITTPGDHVRKYSNLRALSHQSKAKTYRLKFENKCCDDKYSRHDITADDGNPIKVAIYDHDNHIISNGPLSSMQLEIVVLDGEFNKDNKEQWSKDSFRKSIVCGRTGKPPLFASRLYLRLVDGVANLYGAKFQDNSSFVPSKRFKLGVMSANDSISEKILEGISESFAIKDGRGFQNKKDHHPSLSDPIYKLKKIAENGDRQKLLEKMHIKLVQDFLRFYNKDKNSLREACRNIPAHDWDIIVKHALSCKPGLEYTHKGLVEVSKTKAYDNMKAVQYEDKDPCHEHEVIAGDMGSCYLRGSCSMPPVPTQPTGFHDEDPHHGEVLESGPAQVSPRPHRRWVKIVTVVTALHFWNKKSELSAAATFREICSTPLMETRFVGMTDTLDSSWVEAETSDTWDWSSIFLIETP